MMPKAAAAEKIQEPEVLVEVKGDIITVEPDKAKLLFQNSDLVDVFIAQVDERIAAFPEMKVDTKKSRDAIRSTAVAIRDMKTGIDKTGAELADDMRKQVKAIDADRSRIWDLLDERQKNVRKPLTDWEDADKARKEKHQAAINLARKLGQVGFGETVEQIQARIDQLPTNDFPSYEEFEDEARLVVETAFERLVAAKTTRQNEDDAKARAEIERQKLEVERRQFEAERVAERKRQEAEAAERAKAQAAADAAAAAERQRIADEQAAIRKKTADEEAARRRAIDEEHAKLARERAEFEAERQRVTDEAAKKAADEAAARALAEQEAADAEAKLKLEILAAEEEQKKAKLAAEADAVIAGAATVGADLTRTMITEIVEDIVQAYGSDMDKVRAEAIAWALINGEIRHVVYAEPSA